MHLRAPVSASRYRDGMPRVIYNTATTLNGFLADDEDSLSWLFVVPGAEEAESAFSEAFSTGVGALVMGSTTYEWMLDHENLLENPRNGSISDIVELRALLPRRSPQIPGADIRFRSGDVACTVAGDR